MRQSHEINLIINELHKAMDKHPNWPDDPVHAAAIVCEESGELIRAAIQYRAEDGDEDAMYKEAVQTAAMGLRFLLFRGRYLRKTG
jgi:hypothetical protein